MPRNKKHGYKRNIISTCCMWYSPHTIRQESYDMVCLKFYINNVGDVLRRLYIIQPNPYIDKSKVRITITCGVIKIVDNMFWSEWLKKQNLHEITNEIMLLDNAGVRIMWPMFKIDKDPLCVYIHLPATMYYKNQSESPRDLNDWIITGIWDTMTTEWRDLNMSNQILDLHSPCISYLSVHNGILHNAADLLQAEHSKKLNNYKRRSNPLI